jgi:glycosyltransferase involved in cell wall biosynthesis
MKILELCLSPNLGGLELYVFRCAEALSGRHDVLGVLHPEGRLSGYFGRNGIPWYPLVTGLRPLPLIGARRLAHWIDHEQVDVVHMHWGKDLPLAAIAKRLSRRKPRLVYTRQMRITRPKRDIYHRWVWEHVDQVVAITQQLAGDLRTSLPRNMHAKVATLYHGVDSPATGGLSPAQRSALRRELGLPGDGLVVGLLGRIKRSKGQHLLVDAVERLSGEGKAVHGLIVGDAMEPDYLKRLKERVDEAGLPITFRGFTDEPQRLMQACDVVVLASEEETFGLVLAEAMRAAVAVIGSRAGGVPEIIDHEQTGLLFAPGDAVDLACQLRRLESDPVLRAKLAQAGRVKADLLFDPQRHFERLLQLMSNSVAR